MHPSRRVIAAATVALLVVAVPASAQRPAPDTVVVHVTGSALDAAFRAITPPVVASDLPTGDVARTQLVALSRRTTADAELHEHWSDVVFVRRGRATLRTGPALAAPQSRGSGEWAGAGVLSARDRAVASGDVLVIPAGIAHQWRPTGRDAFDYVVVKVRPGSTP